MASTRDRETTQRPDVGQAVRRLRRGRGLTLRDLAGRLGVSAATMSGIENGKTGLSSERVSHIAAALDVSVERLFETSYDDPGDRAETSPSAPVVGEQVLPDGHWRDFPPLELNAALTGALSSFLEFGYHGANMRTIAERAGLSVPGLYHHYASKQEMLVALLDIAMTDLRTHTEAARGEGSDAVERFSNIVECLALFHTHRRELAFVGASEMRSLVPEERKRVAALRMEEQRIVDLEVEDGARSGAFRTTRPHEAARAVVTMCTALAQWFRHEGTASAERVAEQYVGFALDLVKCEVRGVPPTVGDGA
ncbi:MAG: TetR family transcriptional regulator [Nocardioides sp.]|nr:TetR family transcriptional regulator [Nocardioides sp.]